MHTREATRQPSEENTAPDEEMGQEELMYMSVLFDHGQLGVAIYDAVTARLKTLQVPVGTTTELTDILERLVMQFDVHKVLVSSRNASTHGLLQVVKAVNAKQQRSTSVSIRKHADYSYAKACKSIEVVRIKDTWWNQQGIAHKMTRREAYKYLGSYFDFESNEQIRATGALLGFLNAEKIGNQLDDTPGVSLSSVESVALEGIMFIDSGTLKSLQVFYHESHPSLAKGSGRAKEGFSVYGLLNRTLTKAGAAKLRQWMLAPLVNVSAIDERLNAIEYLVSPDKDKLKKSIRNKLRYFGDISRIFNRIRNRCASVYEWSKLNESITSYLAIQELLRVNSARENRDVPSLLENALQERSAIHVSNLLGNVIDFEESTQEKHIVIRTGVSDVLDAARAKYEDLDNVSPSVSVSVLTEVAYQIQEGHPGLTSITVQYIPQVGYVICCDASTALPDFVFQFQEDETTFYYKDSCCRELDASLGDIFGFVLDIQRELLEELTTALLAFEHCVYELVDIVGQVDALASLAEAAQNFNYRRPTVTNSNEFVVKQARHPLQELLVDHYIPIDTSLDGQRTIMIVTGQNGSGKSVYLKLVGLIQFMAQIGSFVPAESAHVGVIQKMFTRIHSMESAMISESSFTIDCNQISRMLQHGRGRSLLLVDEFGKGTAELDGTALLAATVNYLAAQPADQDSSRVLITTHLLDIFRKGLISQQNFVVGDPDDTPSPDRTRDELPSRVVCAMLASTSTPDEISPVPMFIPLHELRPGVLLSSNAFGCALNCGLPPEIIKRAAEVLECRNSNQGIPRRQGSAQAQSVEDQVLTLFTSVDNWLTAPDDRLTKLRTMIQMSDQWSSTPM